MGHINTSWQDQTGNEIDFLLEFVSTILPIEAKSSQTITQNFFKNINYWISLAGDMAKHGY